MKAIIYRDNDNSEMECGLTKGSTPEAFICIKDIKSGEDNTIFMDKADLISLVSDFTMLSKQLQSKED